MQVNSLSPNLVYSEGYGSEPSWRIESNGAIYAKQMYTNFLRVGKGSGYSDGQDISCEIIECKKIYIINNSGGRKEINYDNL